MLGQFLRSETSVINNQINWWGLLKYTKKVVVFVTLKVIVSVLKGYNYRYHIGFYI